MKVEINEMNLRSVAVDEANSNKVIGVGYGFEFSEGTNATVVADVSDETCDAIVDDQRQGQTVCMDPTTLVVTSTPAPPADPSAVDIVVGALATVPKTDPGYGVASTVLSALQQHGFALREGQLLHGVSDVKSDKRR